ncbi:MAG TPA: sulfite exporter TauE/SafE family protein [Gaiellales bacterium]|nr:sulfite exporter TauE/SafE family protein [Gaiellales bacterium]
MIRRLAAVLAGVAALAAAAPAVAQAHPLGNFTVNRYSLVELGKGSVKVTFVLDEAEIPTFQALGGQPTAERARAWADAHAATFARKLHLTVDGQEVTVVPDMDAVTATLRVGQGGLHCMRVTVPLSARISGAGPFTATFTDDTFGDRVGWKEIVMRAEPGAVLTQSSAATHDVSDMLRHYPSGMLSTPLDVRTATFGYRYGSGTSVSVGAPHGSGGESVAVSGGAFTDLVTHRDLGLGFILAAVAIAMFWGAVHALSPGHGKSIVAAYLVGSRGTARHAAFLGLTVTVTHTASIFVLGIVTLYLSQYILPETLYPWLSVVSGLVVVGMGGSILIRRARRLRASQHHHHHHDHAHDHDHGHDHLHHHGPVGHTHEPPAAITVRSMLALGISGGILPCPSALVVMLGAIAVHRVAFGLLLVVAFSIGLAATLTSVGLIVVYVRRLVDRVPSSGRLVQVAPTFSAAVITLLGVGLTVQALGTFPGGVPLIR